MVMGPITRAGLVFQQQCSEIDHYQGVKPGTTEISHNPSFTLPSFSIGQKQFDCKVDNGGHPKVEVSKPHKKTETHTNLHVLILVFTEFRCIENINNLATVINFFFRKNECEFIENPKDYKDKYHDAIERGKYSFEISPMLLYGVYNVEEIQKPHFQDGKLIFYVHNTIPYKVTIEYPITPYSKISYEVLQHQKASRATLNPV